MTITTPNLKNLASAQNNAQPPQRAKNRSFSLMHVKQERRVLVAIESI
jgi:hypothetical protein